MNGHHGAQAGRGVVAEDDLLVGIGDHAFTVAALPSAVPHHYVREMRPSLRSVSVVVVAGAIAASVLIAPATAATPTADAARGTITWSDCPEKGFGGFECGTLTVPLDWDDLSNPANAEIALAVKRATGKRKGYLSFNTGGPGESGLGSAAGVWSALPRNVRRGFDFVAWDPRGIGDSMPQLQGCNAAPEPSYEPPVVGPVDWEALAQAMYDVQAARNTQCLDANPEVAPYLGTYYVIRDLEAMRTALGARKWNFWGMSYGTRIGYRYAREYPDRVRTLILDGAWSPNLSITSWMNGATWNYATAQAIWSRLFGKKMAYRLQRVIDGLEVRTIPVPGGEFTRWSMVGRFWANISVQAAYPDLTAFVNNAYKALYGKSAKKRRAAAKTASEVLELLPRDDQSAALNIHFIQCRDIGEYPTVDAIARTASVAARIESVASAQVALTKGTFCAGLPQDFTYGYEPLTEALELPTPPVVINSLGDTRTEYVFGRTMANFMAGSSLITYDGTQHVTYLQTPSRCINHPVTRYLLKRTQPGQLLCHYAPLLD